MKAQAVLNRARFSESRVPAVDRAIDLLEILAYAKDRLTLSDISKKLNIPLSSTCYVVQTLVRRGYLHRSAYGRDYSLGLRVASFPNPAVAKTQLKAVCTPHLAALAKKTGFSAQVGYLEGSEAVVIESVDAISGRGLDSWIGRHFDLHCTALGKSLIADLSEAELANLFHSRGLPRHNQNTICSLTTLQAHLMEVRNRCYATDNEEHELGARCVAASVRNKVGACIAAVCAFSSTGNMPTWRVPLIGNEVAQVAKDLSRDLLWSVPPRN